MTNPGARVANLMRTPAEPEGSAVRHRAVCHGKHANWGPADAESREKSEGKGDSEQKVQLALLS